MKSSAQRGLFILVTLILVACSQDSPQPTLMPTASQQSTSIPSNPNATPIAPQQSNPTSATPDVTPTFAAAETSEPVPVKTITVASPTAATTPGTSVSITGPVPAEIAKLIKDVVAQHPGRLGLVNNQMGDLGHLITVGVGGSPPIAEWTYVAAAPFATVSDTSTLNDVLAGWQMGNHHLGRLIVDEETAAIYSELWGSPAGSTAIVPVAELTSQLWNNRPSWTILPLHRLTPDLKLISLDGQSPLDDDYNVDQWPFKVAFGTSGDGQGGLEFRSAWGPLLRNFDPAFLTTIAMSGVTALGRATAFQMEIQGVTAPGQAISPVMTAADITHVSHEVSFSPECPYPNPIGDPIFCARDKYLELLSAIGVDVVELTGNHLNDYGSQNVVHSIDLYERAGMRTFGGGENVVAAAEPALFEHNGNKIAFVGCNLVGPSYAWASADRAGSLPCDLQAFYRQIETLEQNGYLVIATIQYYEFYHYEATPQQKLDFRAIAEAGAAAVSGSQGHHVQGFDFHDGAFIHHGLGNLFFDQMDMLGTRQSFIDLYHVYEGRLINVDLYSGLIENYCCPRDMSLEERALLLETVFQASGW
jgi:hypothetical protein